MLRKPALGPANSCSLQPEAQQRKVEASRLLQHWWPLDKATDKPEAPSSPLPKVLQADALPRATAAIMELGGRKCEAGEPARTGGARAEGGGQHTSGSQVGSSLQRLGSQHRDTQGTPPSRHSPPGQATVSLPTPTVKRSTWQVLGPACLRKE